MGLSTRINAFVYPYDVVITFRYTVQGVDVIRAQFLAGNILHFFIRTLRIFFVAYSLWPNVYSYAVKDYGRLEEEEI